MSFNMISRRKLLRNSLAGFVACSAPRLALSTQSDATLTVAGGKLALADSEIIVLSDGHLQLPASFVLPESISDAERDAFLSKHGIVPPFNPPLNITLWQSDDKLVLFDTGSGAHFMPSAGQLLQDFEKFGIDPYDVTDVIFTHAHPDHLWGLLDDFDDLAFPDANYYMNAKEWNYWRDGNTLSNTPEARQSFVVGAQNRLSVLEDRINLFNYGDEVLPGIEAVDSSGHTPGHTSFSIRRENESVMIIGDALTHPIISFEKAAWPSGSDQDKEQGRKTRLALLDRMAADNTMILGYHLPYPGLGRVERDNSAYRFVAA